MSAYTEIPKIKAETGELPPKVLGDLNTRYPGASAQSVEYWVAPPPLGKDDNTGTEDYPLATIAAAVAKLPDVIRSGHTYTITLAPGEWSEQLSPGHITVQGKLTLQGSSGDPDRHKIHRLRADSVLGHLRIEGITTTVKNASGPSFWFERCSFVDIENCAVESDPTIEKTPSGVIGLLADYGSNVWVKDSDFSGKRYGIRANYLSRVFSRNNTGTNNTFGVGARWGGMASLSGTHPHGDTDLTNSSGGILTHEHGAKLGIKDGFGLLQEDAHGDRDPIARTYAIRSNTTSFNEIPANQQVRIRIKGASTGYCLIKAAYAGQVNVSAGQAITRTFGILLRGTSSTSQHETTQFSHAMSDTNMRLEHTGFGYEVDLIIEPQTALSGRWGIDLELSMMTQQQAPEVISVTLNNT